MPKLLLYCTKAKPNIVRGLDNEFYISNAWKSEGIDDYKLNGKIVAECDFEVEKLQIVYGKGWETKTIKGTENIEKLTCLSRDKLYQYCKGKGYAIHIKNLHIFDEPRELSDYYRFNGIYNNINNWKPIDKAPQNMMYAYDLINELGFSGTYNRHLKKNILISIKPEWLCKILNGEKTIEIRKKVLKEMLR